jgi:hypothetical protein
MSGVSVVTPRLLARYNDLAVLTGSPNKSEPCDPDALYSDTELLTKAIAENLTRSVEQAFFREQQIVAVECWRLFGGGKTHRVVASRRKSSMPVSAPMVTSR